MYCALLEKSIIYNLLIGRSGMKDALKFSSTEIVITCYYRRDEREVFDCTLVIPYRSESFQKVDARIGSTLS
jgi:hypothetical protein